MKKEAWALKAFQIQSVKTLVEKKPFKGLHWGTEYYVRIQKLSIDAPRFFDKWDLTEQHWKQSNIHQYT